MKTIIRKSALVLVASLGLGGNFNTKKKPGNEDSPFSHHGYLRVLGPLHG